MNFLAHLAAEYGFTIADSGNYAVRQWSGGHDICVGLYNVTHHVDYCLSLDVLNSMDTGYIEYGAEFDHASEHSVLLAVKLYCSLFGE